MIDELYSAIYLTSGLLQSYDVVTEASVDAAVNYIRMIKKEGGLQSVDLQVLKEKLMEMFHANMDHARILDDKERRKPWLKEFKANDQSEWHFWEDYKKYLKEIKLYPKAVVDELDGLTDSILDRLYNPNVKGVVLDKKGLVVGQVQSGKTSNYTGLICKAADAGFNFIIILAGMMNNLRSQTQLRLDEGFLGFDTQYERSKTSAIGVGKLPTPYEHPIAHSFTSSIEKGDFNKRIAEGQGFNFNTSDPIILVVKKNKSVLTNLYNWLTAKIAPEEQSSSISLLHTRLSSLMMRLTMQVSTQKRTAILQLSTIVYARFSESSKESDMLVIPRHLLPTSLYLSKMTTFFLGISSSIFRRHQIILDLVVFLEQQMMEMRRNSICFLSSAK